LSARRLRSRSLRGGYELRLFFGKLSARSWPLSNPSAKTLRAQAKA
jgi:hypothetical protein